MRPWGQQGHCVQQNTSQGPGSLAAPEAGNSTVATMLFVHLFTLRAGRDPGGDGWSGCDPVDKDLASFTHAGAGASLGALSLLACLGVRGLILGPPWVTVSL